MSDKDLAVRYLGKVCITAVGSSFPVFVEEITIE